MGNLLNSLLFQPPVPPSYEYPFNEHERMRTRNWTLNNPRGIHEHLLWLKTRNERNIPAFFIRYPGSPVVLLYSHGNAEDIGSFSFYVANLLCLIIFKQNASMKQMCNILMSYREILQLV